MAKKSSNSRSKKTLTRLSNMSTRSQALFVIIAIGLVGATWVTIKSFAATSTILWGATEFDAPTYTMTSGSKAGIQYFNFTSAERYRNAKTMKKVSEGGDYKVCLTAKASAPNIVLKANVWLGLNLQGRSISIPQGGDFKKHCSSQTVNLSPSAGAYIKGGVEAVNSPLNVYVTSMSLEKTGSTSNPTK